MKKQIVLCVVFTLGLGMSSTAVADETKPSRRATQESAGASVEGKQPTREQLADLLSAAEAVERGSIRNSARAATAADLVAPVITAPTEDATLSGDVQLSATSTAPKVRFSSSSWSVDVPVVDGLAQTTLDAWGRDGAQTITAVECDDLACGTEVATVGFTVANPAIALTQPAAGTTVGTSFVASVDATGGAVQFYVDEVLAGQTAAAPYQATIDSSGLTQGPHTVTALQCNAALTECGGQAAPAVDITVKNRLTPVLTSAAPTTFSPNGDGRRDTTTLTVQLETAQKVTWRVTNPSGTTVRGPVNLGTKAAGTFTFVFNGKSNSGSYLPSGGYVVRLGTSATVGGTAVTGNAQRGVVIDRTKPGVGSISASPGTVYPASDGYKDRTALRGRLSETVAFLRAEIFTSSGRKVRTIQVGQRSAGLRSIAWGGRTTSGRMMAAGSYRFRFVARDLYGNETTTGKYAVAVSHKKLVRRSGSKTVTPNASYVSAAIGDCSDVFTPARDSWPGSFAHLSDYYCLGDPVYAEDLAMTRHAVTLPAAVKYGSVRVDAYGGRIVPGFPDTGWILYENRPGEITDFGNFLEPALQWHVGAAVPGSSYVTSARRFRFWAGTFEGNWYEIKSFQVRYVYYVLQ